MEKTFEDEIIGAIKKFTAGYTSVRAAAESLGVTYETFRSWHDGIKSPSIKSLSPIARKIGLSLAPEVPTIKRVGSNAPIEKVEGEDLQKVPVYSVAGAGPGVMLDSIEPCLQSSRRQTISASQTALFWLRATAWNRLSLTVRLWA